MSKELAKTYDPEGPLEEQYCIEKWLEKKYFSCGGGSGARSRSPSSMPPPNITGQLHMGHALDNTMQDILIRYKRMQGIRGALAAGHRPCGDRHRG
ncbi:MAG: class I tRNA ligase family protein [Lachnospiraceae bacterium]